MRLANFNLKPHLRLCKEHFSNHSYQRSPDLLRSLGLENERLFLKDDTVPTIFDRGSPKGKKQVKGRTPFKARPLLSPRKLITGSPKKKRREAYEKQQRRVVSRDICLIFFTEFSACIT